MTRSMRSRLATLLTLAVLVTVLGGCSKCGMFWDDLWSKPKSCHSDAPR